jgi:Ni,Fe-hydrogenase maturation factor
MNVTALAVIVDSAVTLGVGYWLSRTAKNQVKKAVDDIGPAIQAGLVTSAKEFTDEAKREIARTIQKVVPVIISTLQKEKKKTDEKCQQEPPILSEYRDRNIQTPRHPSDQH